MRRGPPGFQIVAGGVETSSAPKSHIWEVLATSNVARASSPLWQGRGGLATSCMQGFATTSFFARKLIDFCDWDMLNISRKREKGMKRDLGPGIVRIEEDERYLMKDKKEVEALFEALFV